MRAEYSSWRHSAAYRRFDAAFSPPGEDADGFGADWHTI